jgi:hypothetical protein
MTRIASSHVKMFYQSVDIPATALGNVTGDDDEQKEKETDFVAIHFVTTRHSCDCLNNEPQGRQSTWYQLVTDHKVM